MRKQSTWTIRSNHQSTKINGSIRETTKKLRWKKLAAIDKDNKRRKKVATYFMHFVPCTKSWLWNAAQRSFETLDNTKALIMRNCHDVRPRIEQRNTTRRDTMRSTHEVSVQAPVVDGNTTTAAATRPRLGSHKRAAH